MNLPTTTERIPQDNRILVKGVIIGLLVLLLLIPTFFVTGVIEEREDRQRQAVQEVSAKWAGRQNLTGPMLVLPFMQTVSTDSAGRTKKVKQLAYFLPSDLAVTTRIRPQQRSQGIFKVMLYESQNDLSGRFDSLDLEQLNINPAAVLWQEAFVQFSLSDPKGLNEELAMQWGGRSITFSAAGQDATGGSRMVAPLKISALSDLKQVSFSGRIHLNGSESMYLTPVGRSTTFTVQSAWPHPSFTGAILPQQTAVSDSGFSATWKSMAHKRSFPQQWVGNGFSTEVPTPNPQLDAVVAAAGSDDSYNLGRDAFGVDLFIPVNDYQKTMRSIKYAVLFIVLTFTAFFLVETAHKRSVHPFQYALIGIALVLFFLLLLSFSEYIGFNWAYAIAALATVSLIAWFMRGLLGSGKLSTLLTVVLVLLYSYVFTILQLQDYSLILGSIGLFLSLAIVMRYSRKFQW
ncbi:cell envelope integrity protein CreD [Pseudocnuella soli]|uniref:cell envelope integrity protein CreD n=1 Tax=Pseudocnuella soli TaxID=2502779 RepID=UPI0010439335|nr:cell envelope integrity protein CreD [Pseudocnuella soli]